MALKLPYGQDRIASFDVPAGVLVADWSSARVEPHGDPTAAVAEALRSPLDFPPLSQAVIPGDRVALALADDVPCPAETVAGVVAVLLETGIAPEDISIVEPARSRPDPPQGSDNAENGRSTGADGDARVASRDPLARLDPSVAERIERRQHNPGERSELGYLAADHEGRPIYMNRVLCDADVVLPISATRLAGGLTVEAIDCGLFPTFSDQEAIDRFYNAATEPTDELSGDAGAVDHPGPSLGEEAEEAAWLLGVQLVLQLVPGPAGSLLNAVAGTADAVDRQCRSSAAAAWEVTTPRRAELVIVSIQGESQQTWEHVARALHAADRIVEDGGAVALCTQLSEPPGPPLQRLQDLDERPHGPPARQAGPQDVCAAVLAEMRERVRVLLLSDLDEETVEDLGLGYIETADQFNRLCNQYESCIVLADGHLAHPTISASPVA